MSKNQCSFAVSRISSKQKSAIALSPHFSQNGTKAVCGFPYHSNRPTPLPYNRVFLCGKGLEQGMLSIVSIDKTLGGVLFYSYLGFYYLHILLTPRKSSQTPKSLHLTTSHNSYRNNLPLKLSSRTRWLD